MSAGIQAAAQLFGNDKKTPLYVPGAKALVKPLSQLTKSAITSVTPDWEKFKSLWDSGTARQESLMGEEEGIGRTLLDRRLNYNPIQQFGDLSKQLFSLIDPNVISPLSARDVNENILQRRAYGLNPAAVDSTAARLRNSRISSGRYYDVAKQLSGLLSPLFNQTYNAGVNNDEMAAGYIPSIMAGYRNLDDASLTPVRSLLSLSRDAAGASSASSDAFNRGIAGWEQKRNFADRLGDADTAAWNNIKDVANTAMSIYGSLYGGGAGGMLGGMMGGMGGGGGGSGGGSSPTPAAPRFIPSQQMQAPPAWQGPPYNPAPAWQGPPWNPYQQQGSPTFG